ncbi:MAG: 50S ribosomal protein L21 [Syntrophales bacterium]|nr:50S ribosomal protein L21 [Syntrophales bacterium]
MSYAVIETGGKQYRVSEGDIITVEKIEGGKGDTVIFDRIYMVKSGSEYLIGTPNVRGAQVISEIVAQIKGPKIYVFKMKRRKGYRKKTGHRQRLTQLRIREIRLS